MAPDFYRFNRVENVFLGMGNEFRLSRHMDARLKLGYAFGTKQLQQQFGLTYYLQDSWRVRFTGDYRLRTVSRHSFTTWNYNPAGLALLAQLDPYNYYGTQELNLSVSLRPFTFSRLWLTYYDARHTSQSLDTDYSLFNRETAVRDNPAIDDGRLRSVRATFQYDNRPLYRQASRNLRLSTTEYTRLVLGFEYSSPDGLDSDFDFKRVYARFLARKRLPGFGMSTAEVFAGETDGTLPAQRYFGVDFGNGVFFDRGGFGTLFEQTFGGGRVVSATLHHDFRTALFTKTGLPVLKDIPVWLSIHGGIMWADFVNLAPVAGDALTLRSEEPYSELGFGLGNLTPFLSPLNFSLSFTWQLSGYETRDFVIRLGAGL
jgi:hypothetical protein